MLILEVIKGFNIHHYKEVTSTNSEALDLIRKGITNETIIIADKQTGGRGRTGKHWVSPEGNFYCSFIINQKADVTKLTELIFTSAIAVGNTLINFIDHHQWCHPSAQTLGSSKLACKQEQLDKFGKHQDNRQNIISYDAIAYKAGFQCRSTGMTTENFARDLFINGLNVQYKWPNDVLINGKKISGILLEKVSSSDWLVIGIGININYAPLSGATCISDYGMSISNMDLLKELILNFNKIRKCWLFEGFHAIREIWLSRAFKLNNQISIKLANKLYEGIFTNIDKSGKLMLQQKDDSLVYFDAGELFIV